MVAVPSRPVRRVVSLVPSLTAGVWDLGAGDRLVGRTRYCVEPPAVRVVPVVGGTKNPDLAAIIARRPDLVLACAEENKPEHLAALRAAGLTLHVVMPRSLDDVDRLLADLGELLDVNAAAARARAELAAARRAAAVRRRGQVRRRVAALIWREPWLGIGGRVYGDAVLRALGLENVLADRSDYPPVTLDELAARCPDLLLLPDEPFPFRPDHAAELLAAGVVSDPSRIVLCDGRLLTWYGTRTAPALRRLAGILDAVFQ